MTYVYLSLEVYPGSYSKLARLRLTGNRLGSA
jgi:hypothetical protein